MCVCDVSLTSNVHTSRGRNLRALVPIYSPSEGKLGAGCHITMRKHRSLGRCWRSGRSAVLPE